MVTTGNPTPTLTEVGTLPKGVTYSNGVISGTPKKLGTFQLAFLADNGIGDQYVQYFTLTVTTFQVTTTTLPDATVGTPYSVQLAGQRRRHPVQVEGQGDPAGRPHAVEGGSALGHGERSVRPARTRSRSRSSDSKTPTAEVLSVTLSLTVDG